MQVLKKILGEIENLNYYPEGMGCGIEDCGITDRYEGCEYGWDKAMKAVLEVINNMNDGNDTDVPTNNGWIPCSERLPSKEEYEQLIITDVHGNVYANVIYGYAEDEDKEPCFHEWDDEYWQCRKYEAIAWQKYPEPYKPKELKAAKNTQQEMEDFWRDK